MKVKNYTKYNTADLKKLFLACCREVRTGRGIRKRLIVEVVEHERLNARASYWGTWAKIVIGKWLKDYGEKLNVRKLAWLACHEFHHSKGIRHRQMLRSNTTAFYYRAWRSYQDNPDKMAWADQYQIREKEVKPKPKVDWQLVRYERVKTRVKEYITKVKRTQNLLKKYLQKQRHYEKVLTAAGKIKPKEQ